jgi:signal transduction histidine kinase
MDRIQNDSIARKLTWMNMLVSGTALLLACVAFIGFDWVTFRVNSARNLSVQAQVIAANSAAAVLFNDPESAEKTLAVLKASPNIISAGVFAADGRPFATYQRRKTDQIPKLPTIPEGQSDVQAFAQGRAIVVEPIVIEGKNTGKVYIESDQQALYVRVRRYAGIASIVWVGSLLAALLVSSIFRRSVTEPIAGLAETARIVTRDKKYSVRAQPARKMSELTILIDAFNEMLAEIERRDGDLQEARDELERRVEERTAQLAAANKELEAFSYSVSHDLRAPLRSIDGFSQAVLEDYSDQLDATGKENLQRVRAAAVRMATLIDDLLKLSRVTRAELRKEPSDLTAMARAIAHTLEEEEPGRRVEFNIGEGLTVDGDSRLLRVVMENLLGNAWKYTSHHDHARIELGQGEKNGRSVFYVRDDGAGFDPRYADRLFGAFQRLHGVKDFPGTGIGLATVQRIIHRHGGEIWAEAEIEKGATFYFSVNEHSN